MHKRFWPELESRTLKKRTVCQSKSAGRGGYENIGYDRSEQKPISEYIVLRRLTPASAHLARVLKTEALQ